MLFAALSCSSYLAAQANNRLPLATFNQLAAICTPNAAVDTLDAVALTESALHPYALSLNYPATVAAYNGLHNQEVYLQRGPGSAFVRHGTLQPSLNLLCDGEDIL